MEGQNTDSRTYSAQASKMFLMTSNSERWAMWLCSAHNSRVNDEKVVKVTEVWMFLFILRGLICIPPSSSVFKSVIKCMLECEIILSLVCKVPLRFIKLCAASLSRQIGGIEATGKSDSCLCLLVIQTFTPPCPSLWESAEHRHA